MIFEIFLKRFDGIVSDGTHSEMGEKYWRKLIKKALEDGYNCFALDEKAQYIKIESEDELENFYGDWFDSANKRFKIKSK